MVKLNVELAGDVEAECYAKLTTGSRCLLWYPDDSVWHEAMIGLVTSPDSAVIYTPDGDLYREVLSCLGESGPSRLRGLLPNMNLPRNLRAPAYRFRDRITDERVKQVLRDSLDVAEAEGYEVELPKKVVDAAGQEIDLNTMFGGHFLRRRIVAPAGRMPAAGFAAENGSPKNAVVVRPATGDSVWVAAEPLGCSTGWAWACSRPCTPSFRSTTTMSQDFGLQWLLSWRLFVVWFFSSFRIGGGRGILWSLPVMQVWLALEFVRVAGRKR